MPERRNQRWSIDFASGYALWTGRRFRFLCLVDDARESPALLVDFSIGGERGVRLLDELACRHACREIVMDNGPEFTGRALFAWC